MLAPTIRRLSLLGLLAALSLMLAGTFAAQRAGAATYAACIAKKGKKKGQVRIVSAKKKCRKSERKISWNSSGVPGTPGTPGTPGANGQNGVPGQPQKATSFSVASDVVFLGSKFTQAFTLGDVSVRMACSNALVANIVAVQATGPAGSTAQTGMVATRLDNSATQAAQSAVQSKGVATNTEIVTLVSNSAGELTNIGYVHGSIVTPTQVVVFDAYVRVGPSSPTACQLKGSAFAIPR